MTNRDLFQKDPLDNRLRNDGVARISSEGSAQEEATLRYELESFVCEGQYADGLIRILEAFTKGLASTSQQAVWVSGFFGSGKSHLLKMLHHLWVDTRFADGATARGVCQLPDSVRDLLRELSTEGRRHGGLHAAAGTLPSGGSKSVRLAVLGIVLRSCGLPAGYAQARFVLWLREHGLEERVISSIQAGGKTLDQVLDHLYTSPDLARALLAADPHFARDEAEARATLRAQFPNKEDIETTEFLRLIRDILPTAGGQLPLTAIILDEVQIYIGTTGNADDRSQGIQEAAEALCKQMENRVLLIGAGQTALASGTPFLQKLQGRFTIPVELSDTDVETVIRRVVLAKKASAFDLVRRCLDENAGEISRHLSSSRIAANPSDRGPDWEDYPLLPVRRRFWELALRAVDVAGTQSQLRSQLRIVHDAVAEIAKAPVGHVVPGDSFFDQQAASLLRSGVLLRAHHETITKLDDGTPSGRLKRRLCGLVWLIRKLPRDAGADPQIRATAETLADLLVTDLAADGPVLRRDIPPALEGLVANGTLILLDGGEYSLQTRESSEWDADFRAREAKLKADLTGLATRRVELFKAACQKLVGSTRFPHPGSIHKTSRELSLFFGAAPADYEPAVPVWIRDAWGESDKTVLADARKAGSSSPVVFVWIDKKGGDDLITALVTREAASLTIEAKGVPQNDAAREARDAMQTRLTEAEIQRDRLVREAIDAARVWVGGGTEQHGLQFRDKIFTAAEIALARLFPRFAEADFDATKWNSVKNRAQAGDEAALEAIGHKGKPEDHSVCKAVLAAIGSIGKGREVRATLEGVGTGWPRDAVDAALILLHTCGRIRATHNGAPVPAKGLDHNNISIAEFTSETTPIQAAQKIQLRKLYSQAGIPCAPGEESAKAAMFLQQLATLAELGGGAAPLPPAPASSWLDALRQKAGNEQLTAILASESALKDALHDWSAAADLAQERLPRWETLTRLLAHATTLPEAVALQAEADSIAASRRLLDASDPVPSLLQTAANALRAALTGVHQAYQETYSTLETNLAADPAWKALASAQRKELLAAESLSTPAPLHIGDESSLLHSLDQIPLTSWRHRTDALEAQFARVRVQAAKLLEPKVQHIRLSSETLRTEVEVRHWLAGQEADLLARIQEGPIVIS